LVLTWISAPSAPPRNDDKASDEMEVEQHLVAYDKGIRL